MNQTMTIGWFVRFAKTHELYLEYIEWLLAQPQGLELADFAKQQHEDFADWQNIYDNLFTLLDKNEFLYNSEDYNTWKIKRLNLRDKHKVVRHNIYMKFLIRQQSILDRYSRKGNRFEDPTFYDAEFLALCNEVLRLNEDYQNERDLFVDLYRYERCALDKEYFPRFLKILNLA